ncbi:MAG: preprotein translocase subunit SecY [Candidatus Aenigmarchaeota archaeon]|nr:preprotein translocase subunit SecY [Candidatus Aenigmarchaeota archaeon]
MSILDTIGSKFPGVEGPKGHLSFKARLKWTGLILLIFLLLGQITVFGISQVSLQQFQFLEIVLGSSIGSLMTLGIGPIVTASIILQLLVGSKLLPWDIRSEEGKRKFQSMQKLLTIFFCFFESFAYVAFGAIRPSDPSFMSFIIVQLTIGGILVLFMDEVISKWGIGSGVSLFIAAGVTKTIFVRAFNPLTAAGSNIPAGLVPQFITFISIGDLFQAFVALVPIISTIVVFLIVVYAQSLKVEIPIAFGSIRGFARRWPLNLIYTSNIPVILIAALLANLQLMGSMVAKTVEEGTRCGFLGCFNSQGSPISGLVLFFNVSSSLSVQVFFLTILVVIFAAAFAAFYFKFKESFKIVVFAGIISIILAFLLASSTTGLPTGEEFLRSIVYLLILVGGSVVFSIFWVTTSGMDARSVAEQIEGMGMQIPGFRRDPRIIEQVLERYIPTLTIISGFFIGLLAAIADFTGALGTGTGILLTVMIIYQLYESIATRYVEDMHPAVRKFFE